MIVIRRLFVGFCWLIAVYFTVVIVGGMISGGIASYDHDVSGADFSKDDTFERLSGGFAGEAFVEKYCEAILMFALLFSTLGTVTGLLPGTRSTKEAQLNETSGSQKYSASQLKIIKISAWVILAFGSADIAIGVLSRKMPFFGAICFALGLYLLLVFLKKYSPKNNI